MGWLIRLGILWAWLAQSASAGILQARVDAAPAGSTLTLEPGIHDGPLSIAKPLTLEGGGKAEIRGKGVGTVVSISGARVVLRGLRITGSGTSHDAVDAGVLVEGNDHEIADNMLEDVLFGIHLKQVNGSRVRDNRITGKDRELGLRGDGLRAWYSRDNLIEGNRFRRARDLTFANSPQNSIVGNHFSDGRYGMHIVFSPRLRVERNHLSDTGTGIVVLYSPGLTLRGNRVEHALAGGGAGIVFKESDDGVVEDNEILHCAAGIKIDAPPEPMGTLLVRGNRFAHNIVGLYFYGEAGGHRFEGNSFEKNLSTVVVSAPGAGAKNVWQGNHWDDYQGFDRDGDGIGDTPHEVWLHADRIWMETPMAGFFRNSPGLEMLDFLERLAPFSTPHRLIRDPAPRMRR